MAANGYIVVAPNRRGMPATEWSGMSKSKVRQVMDDYLQPLTTSLKKVMLTTPRLGLCWRVAVGRRFIWQEYITIVLKRSLLTMAFSTRRACLAQPKKYSCNWDFVSIVGEGRS
jgi:hypothetical protein